MMTGKDREERDLHSLAPLVTRDNKYFFIIYIVHHTHASDDEMSNIASFGDLFSRLHSGEFTTAWLPILEVMYFQTKA
jgi:hypothetical protein